MARSYEDILADVTPERRRKIEARAEELRQEVEAFQQLRLCAKQTRSEIAQKLGIEKSAAEEIERQTELHLSTLRRVIEAAGGSMSLEVTLPGKGTVQIKDLGDLAETAVE